MENLGDTHNKYIYSVGESGTDYGVGIVTYLFLVAASQMSVFIFLLRMTEQINERTTKTE